MLQFGHAMLLRTKSFAHVVPHDHNQNRPFRQAGYHKSAFFTGLPNPYTGLVTRLPPWRILRSGTKLAQSVDVLQLQWLFWPPAGRETAYVSVVGAALPPQQPKKIVIALLPQPALSLSNEADHAGCGVRTPSPSVVVACHRSKE
jgi:hypothetical protein